MGDVSLLKVAIKARLTSTVELFWERGYKMKKWATRLAGLLSVVALSCPPAFGSGPTLSNTSGNTGIFYAIQSSEISKITSPRVACSNKMQVVVTTPNLSSPTRYYNGSIEVGLYSDLGILYTEESVTFKNAMQNNLTVTFPGCGGAGATWRSHTWEAKIYSTYIYSVVTNWGAVSSIKDDETISLGTFESPANRPKPKVILATVLPSSKTANVVLGTNALFGDPKFQYSYQVTPESSKPASTKWKISAGEVFVLTGLKSKFKYAIHTRAMSFDGVVGPTKTTKFKTK